MSVVSRLGVALCVSVLSAVGPAMCYAQSTAEPSVAAQPTPAPPEESAENPAVDLNVNVETTAASENRQPALGPTSSTPEIDAEALAPETVAASTGTASNTLPWWPWLVSVPLLTTAISLELTQGLGDPRWTSAGSIDQLFGAWVAGSREGRNLAAAASDVLFTISLFAPMLDAVLWPTPGRSRSRTTYRLLAMDVLSFGVEGMISVATKLLVRRARPYTVACAADPEHSPSCDSRSSNQSFVSGHSATAFTGASLVCAHQQIRGYTPTGYVECVSALAMATFTGALRVVSEHHYFSDTLVGALVGFLSGYVLPMLIFEPEPEAEPQELRAMAW